MIDEAHLKSLVLHHGLRVRRLWFMGAGLCFCIGLAIGGHTLYARYRDKPANQDKYDRTSDYAFEEGLQAAAAIGLGFTFMLGLLGLFSFKVCRHFVNSGVPVRAELKNTAVDALVTAGAGHGLTALLGLIAPVRTAAFTIEHEGKEVNLVGHMFANEKPYTTENSQCRALKFIFMNKPAALMVFEECREP